MSTHARVEPIGEVDGAVGTDGHIGWTEHRLKHARGAATEEVRARPFLLLIRGDEVKALELHAGAIRLRQVAEDDVLTGFTG